MPIRYKICRKLYPNELIFTFLNIPDDFMPFWASFEEVSFQLWNMVTILYVLNIVKSYLTICLLQT